MLGATKDPAFSLPAMIAVGIAVAANVALYGVLGYILWACVTRIQATLRKGK
jgi:hypothetical protein